MSKRIPTLLGVFILIAGLVAGVILVNKKTGFESKAGPSESPKNLKISNLSATTFSVSWSTDIPLTGLIKFSEDPVKITTPGGDVRDQISGTSQSYNNHTVNISGLSASKTYYFLVVSGSGTFDDNGKPFQVRTATQAIAPPEDIIFGKVVRDTGDPVNGGIVFLEAEGGQTLSTITQTDGTWRLNLANSRDKDGKILTYDPEKTLLSIFVQAGNTGTATALTDTSKDQPVPDIVMGKNQSFVDTGRLLSGIEDIPPVQTGEGFQLEVSQLTLSDQLEATSSVKILNPATNGEIIATDKPELRGKAPAGTVIKLTLNSVEMTQVVQADNDGNWKWTPPQKLDPGQHTLTVEFTDSANQIQRIVRTFTVLLSNLPAFTATPSATPTGLIGISPTPTAVTLTPAMPATQSAVLVPSGELTTTFGLALLGILMLLIGSLSKKWLK
ncbi:MAG: Large repetitive protein [Candidatus Collierbacteria bacterium GW2011_GWB1_44_197]|nr:MAG: Large repetitive protein [Candidatus Collierbacteria bacterium GW2011_GWB1_44_197]KKT66376.1 MAG: Large repetitive protein [Candidatus Collierbacteria bacterium GW2011_GWC2_44_30]